MLRQGLMVLALLAFSSLAAQAKAPPAANPYAPYILRAEWTGPCRRAARVDVNLGNGADAFVRAASCQISGTMPDAMVLQTLTQALRLDDRTRRIDVVQHLCAEAHRACDLVYSDPWTGGPDPTPAPCDKRFKRDIGAVVMFFFHCPDGVNCSADWASNHVRGMHKPDRQLAWGGHKTGYYVATQPGFWRHELRATRRAGLQYILPNLYGPDMTANGEIDTLVQALNKAHDPVKIGLFDDSWAWGEAKFGPPWSSAPDLSDTRQAATTLYESKWRPYFRKIPTRYWYRIDNRPVIYFYNAGTLHPASKSAAVLSEMKQRFATDFGVTPYLVVDDAFFADPDMVNVADSRFRWDSLAGNFRAPDDTVTVDHGLATSRMKKHSLSNAFVRWDSLGRDGGGAFADRLIKGPQVLQDVLSRTHDDDSLLIATWNDLGEGTGINDSYDYYYRGQWLSPDYFMDLVRKDNCRN